MSSGKYLTPCPALARALCRISCGGSSYCSTLGSGPCLLCQATHQEQCKVHHNDMLSHGPPGSSHLSSTCNLIACLAFGMRRKCFFMGNWQSVHVHFLCCCWVVASEVALSVVANLVHGDDEARAQALVSVHHSLA